MSEPILCVGEVLFDVFPAGAFLGGAPLNVAYHLRALGRPARVASRVGTDDYAARVRRALLGAGLDEDLLQTDDLHPTGQVTVTLLDAHTPQYDLRAAAAWDFIAPSPRLQAAAAGAAVVVFGSLAQRATPSRQTIQSLVERPGPMRVFDVNLRPPFVDPAVIDFGLRHCELLKLNDAELRHLRQTLNLPAGDADAARAISDRFGCNTVCVTRGAGGAMLLRSGKIHDHPGHRVDAVDPVGAGDAFLAALLDGLLQAGDGEAALDAACATGAYVATQPSATPPLDRAAIDRLRRGRG
jgi:fructokinase